MRIRVYFLLLFHLSMLLIATFPHSDDAPDVSCDARLPYNSDHGGVIQPPCATLFRGIVHRSRLAPQSVSCINKMRWNGRSFDTPQFRAAGRRSCF